MSTPERIDVATAAQLADMPVEDFRSLNAGYHHTVILQASAHPIVLPVDKVDTFVANLANNQTPLVSWQTYTANKGETLQHIARKYGISLKRLREVNGFSGRMRISARRALLVPCTGQSWVRRCRSRCSGCRAGRGIA